MTGKWGLGRAAVTGATVAAAWGYWKILESKIPWSGDGAAYNGGRLGGAIITGALFGLLIAWARNRFFA
jgi:hypothetical protein